jgi:hypothetical protein
MGNRVVVKPHTTGELVSIRPVRKGGKPHFMGSCMLKNVEVTPDGITGDLLEEWTEARELGHEVLDRLTELVWEGSDGFGIVTVHETDGEDIVSFESATGNTYRAAYVVGSEVYVG